MDATTLKMAMAGLFHDIGKIADRDTMGVTEKYFNDNANIYLPSHDGNFSHYHALYTAAFVDQMGTSLPPELNSRIWGEGDSFINLAASHHKPETPMQQIITVADWLTSGMDRDEFEGENAIGIAFQDYKKTRLLPLFEQLKKPEMDTAEKFAYAYPLAPLSPEAIFPKKRMEMGKMDEKERYRRLYDGFTEDLAGLLHRSENLSLWFEHFESLMMTYLSSVPAARAGKVVHDVSLYDHSRLTSAFASALFLYHSENGTLDTLAIKDRKDRKFLLVSGNFFGIQNFIFSGYGDTRKYRSKLLRGRSFYVSLLSELAADMLCRELGLPFTSVIFNAAARFTVLAPNTKKTEQQIEETKKQMDDWLMKIGFGEISIGISQTEASYEDFSPDRFFKLWDKIGREMEESKFAKIDLERYGGVIPGYLDQFNGSLRHPVCPLCGKRPASPDTLHLLPSDGAGPVCRICRDHVFIGTLLVKKAGIIIVDKDAEFIDRADILLEPIFDRYQLLFPESLGAEEFDSQKIRKIWDISKASDGRIFRGIAKKILNSYVPAYEDEDLKDKRIVPTGKSEGAQSAMIDEMALGDPMSMGHIAAKALNVGEDGKISGIAALGVMKADMDYLGMLMACGLTDKRQTVSRMATLSRQVNHFFALYLPHLLMKERKFRDIYTVFAGGDDLFLIGPWNRIYELSLTLERTFRAYVCENRDVTFSAGISLQKAHTPLSSLAESAEGALEKSKIEGRNRLTMFSETTAWSDMGVLESIRGKLESWLEKGWITKSMLYRLNTFITMAAMEKVVLGKSEIFKEDMNCLKWRALFSYSAARSIEKNKETDQMAEWLESYGGCLRIPLWNVLYNHR